MQHVNLEFVTSDKQIIRLCQLYWDLDSNGYFKHKASELSREFNVPINRLAVVVSQSAVAFSTLTACSMCGIPYAFSGRVDFQQHHGSQVWVCGECQLEQEGIKNAEMIAAEERYRKIISEQYGLSDPAPLDASKLSFETVIYLLSLTRLLATGDCGFAMPLESAHRCLSPTNQMDNQILGHLLREQVISVSPSSDTNAFVGSRAESFYLTKVHWKLPTGVDSMTSHRFIRHLEQVVSGNTWPAHWLENRLGVWRKVALHESLQYLAVALDSHGFLFTPGEKTFAMFNSLLDVYSVSQIYNLIWRATKDAAAFYLRGGITKQHAANSIVGGIERYGNRARAENWSVKHYHRRSDCPESVVSEVLFNVALRIGDQGFNEAPNGLRLNSLPQFSLLIANS